MRLRAKTFAIVGGITLGLGVVVSVVTCVSLLHSARRMEDALAAKDVERARLALSGETETLRDTCRYWSIWDDAYAFARDRNPRFIEANLYDTVLRESRIEFILFIAPDGSPIYAKSISGEAGEPAVDTPAAIRAFVSRSRRARVDPGDEPVGLAGVLVLEGSPVLVAAGPILTSTRRGPSRGTLVVGRRLGRSVVDRLRRATALDVDVTAGTGAEIAGRLGGAAAVIRRETSRLEAFSRIDDLGGGPAGVLRVAGARETYAHARFVALVVALGCLAISLVASLSVVMLVERAVLARLAHLVASLEGIRRRRDFTERVPIEGGDELADLSRAINATIESLEHALSDVERRDEQLRERTRSLEEAVVAADAANRAKSQFLANMSHEIRTPINGVVGMLRLLQHRELDARRSRYVDLAMTSADTLLAVIDDILDFSKIEAGKLEIEQVDLDLREAVEDVAQMFAGRQVPGKLEIVTHIPSNTTTRLRGDPTRLRQILVNLTSNALKFTETGQIVLRVEPLAEGPTDVRVRVSVEDTGIGIDAEQQLRLFRPFSQGDSSTTRKYGGTGLGLAICGELVRLMGGEITLQSEPGRGSTFSFVLRMEKSGAPAAATASHAAIPAGVRILAVDDNDVVLDSIVDQLTALGCDATGVHGEREALEVLDRAGTARERYAAVLVDGTLAGGGATSLGKAVRNHPRLRETRLVLLDLLGREEPTETRAMFDASVPKPIRRAELADTLATLVGGSVATDASGHPPAEPDGVEPPGVCILLAEDNEINAEVVQEILRGAGYACDRVADGGEAVDAALSGGYGLILMDCQMPVVDGVEATRRIRSEEARRVDRGDARGRLPIVALTANALRDDRDCGLAAGMDDYLTKPLRTEELLATVARWLRRASVPERAHEATAAPALDLAAAVDACMGSTETALHLIARLEASARDLSAEIERAVAAGDAAGVVFAAHTLKGAAAQLSIDGLSRSAAALEAVGRTGDLRSAGDGLDGLRREIDRFRRAAAPLIAAPGGSSPLSRPD